jgi:hypothetical protein
MAPVDNTAGYPADEVRQRFAIVAFVVLAVLVKAPQVLAPMGQDQGLYHGIAQEILHGAVPYRDAWDPKPPGVFYVHAALLSSIPDPWRPCRLGSLPGLPRSDLQPRCGTLLFEVVDFGFSLALAGLVWALARRMGLSHGGAAVAFGLTAVFANLALLDPEGSTPEKYALVPAVGVLLAGLRAIQGGQRGWLVLAGVLAALAALLKQTDLASFGALSLLLLLRGRGRDLIWLWAPLAIVLLGVGVAFTLMGAGGQLVDATLGYNVGRFRFQAERIPLAGVLAAWQVFRDGMALLWLLAGIGAVVAWRRAEWRLLVMWAALDIVALVLGGTRFTREYFVQLVPSFAVLAALAGHALWADQARVSLGRAWLALSLATVAVLSSSFQVSFALRIWNDYVASGWSTTSVERLGTMVDQLPAGESLFVWGDEGQLYPLSGRLPTTRFLNTTGLAVTGDPAVQQRRAELFGNLARNPPAVIVVDRRTADDDPNGSLQLNRKAVPQLELLLSQRYREMDAAVLRSYVGGGREQVYIRQGGADLCAQMNGCRLT